MSHSLLSRFIQELLPFFHYVHYRRRFLKEASAADKPGVAASYEKLAENELESLLKDERARAASMDEKTFKLTLSLTFALTIMGTVSATLLSGSDGLLLRSVVGSLLALVVFYALGAGFVALGAMRTLPSHGLGAYPDLKEKPGARREFLAASLARNEKIGLARHARNETAYIALRNSFLCLFALLALYVAVQSASVITSARSWFSGTNAASAPMPRQIPAGPPCAKNRR